MADTCRHFEERGAEIARPQEKKDGAGQTKNKGEGGRCLQIGFHMDLGEIPGAKDQQDAQI